MAHFKKKLLCNTESRTGGRPGLLAMGGDSCSRRCGFESQHSLLDVQFSSLICWKNVFFCLRRPKINEKEAYKYCVSNVAF